MDDKSTQNIPQNEIDALARLLLPKIQEYFESETGKEEIRTRLPQGRISSDFLHFGTPDTIRTCDLQSRSFQVHPDKMLCFQGVFGF